MGASGFVGSHVTRKLVERGDDVRVYLRKSSSTAAIDDLDVERCYGDLRDEEALREAMADRDVVFYCVVVGNTCFYQRDPSPLVETNVESLRRVLDHARTRGLPAVAMCVSNPYGPLDWQPSQGQMIKAAALGKMPVYVKGVSTEVVGIEDVAEAFLLAGDRDTAPAHHVSCRSQQGDARARMGTPPDRRVDPAGGAVLRRAG